VSLLANQEIDRSMMYRLTRLHREQARSCSFIMFTPCSQPDERQEQHLPIQVEPCVSPALAGFIVQGVCK
jgi:hypothetical protein